MEIDTQLKAEASADLKKTVDGELAEPDPSPEEAARILEQNVCTSPTG